MNKNKILPVVLCGGKGSRLWPLSRESFPKQLLTVMANENQSLLQKTIKKLKNSNILMTPS